MRQAWDLVGWETLSPDQQQSAIYGGIIGAGFWATASAIFGFPPLHRRRKRRRRKGRRR